jgi:hypothetical protein
MKTSILFLLAMLSFSVFGQDLKTDVAKKSNCLKITSYNMSIGSIFNSGDAERFSDLKRLLSEKDPTLRMPSDDYIMKLSGKSLFNFKIELGLTSIAKPNRELLIGLSYISGDQRSFEFNKSSHIRTDTLHVQDYTFYVDSSFHSSFKFTENVQEMGINMAYIYKTAQDRKFSLYAGYGLNIGYSTYSQLIYNSVQDSNEELVLKNDPNKNNHYFYNDIESKLTYEKYFESDPSFFLRAYIPFGLNLKLSKRNPFWNHVSLQLNCQFGLVYRNISNDISYTKVYFSFPGVGMKVSF